MIRIYRVNTGSCGGCDIEVMAAVAATADLAWAATPAEADLVVLTGPLTPAVRPFVQVLLAELQGRVPVCAIGGCAIDGRPFGRGGLAEQPEIAATARLEGCPPALQAIIDAIRGAPR
jgi:Ni,Fe-hydrogenase III small subunit